MMKTTTDRRSIARRRFGAWRGTAGALILGAVLAVAASGTQAADSGGKFAVKGAGIAPCSAFVAAVSGEKPRRLAAFNGWLEGYLTASNRHEGATYDLVAWQSRGRLLALLGNFCRKNPKKRFYLAVRALANTLKPNRIRSQSQLIEASAGQKKVRIYRATLGRVQRALARLGFYAGKIDGRFGPNTRLGLEAFQQKEKLQLNGLPDQRTLIRLLNRPRPAQSPKR